MLPETHLLFHMERLGFCPSKEQNISHRLWTQSSCKQIEQLLPEHTHPHTQDQSIAESMHVHLLNS